MAGRHRATNKYRGTHRAPLFGGNSGGYRGRHRDSFMGRLLGNRVPAERYRPPKPVGKLPAMWDQWGPYSRPYPTATYGTARSSQIGRIRSTFKFPFGGVT